MQLSSGTGGSKVYWNGAAWIPTISSNVATIFVSSWTYTLPSLVSDKNYYLKLQVQDNVTGTGVTPHRNTYISTISTFTYDTSVPSVTISQPLNNAFHSQIQISTPFAGTSSDPGGTPSGISTVTISLTDVDGGGPNYWTGSTFTAGGPFFIGALGTTANWTYTHASLFFKNDHRYDLAVRASDNAGNVTTVTNRFVYDVLIPTTTISSPSGLYFTTTTAVSVSGTATDNLSGALNNPAWISTGAVQLAVKRLSNNLWWNGANFSATDPNYATLTVTNSTTPIPNTWTSSLPGGLQSAFTSGISYRFVSRATDQAGNVEFGPLNTDVPAGTGVSLLYDSSTATSQISVPSNGGVPQAVTLASGTMDDTSTGSGILAVDVAFVDTLNAYWNGSGWTGDCSSGCTPWLSATVVGITSGTWSYNSLSGAFSSNARYKMFVRARDNAGNIPIGNLGSTFDFVTGAGGINFTVDSSSPTSQTTLPTNNVRLSSGPLVISGTASDVSSNGSGIASGGVKIRIGNSSGQYYNPSTALFDNSGTSLNFPLAAQVTPGILPNYTWSVTTGPAISTNVYTDDRYTIQSRANDRSGNFEVAYNTVTFTLDTTAPITLIQKPVNGAAHSIIEPMTVISGTASDPNTYPAGVSRVYVSVEELSGGATHYFNGANFGATTEYFLIATSTASWSYWNTGLDAVNLTNGATYIVHAYAVDAVGNTETPGTTSTVIFDTDTPHGAVSSPADNDVQQNPASIAGTAADVGLAGIRKVQISLRLDNAPTGQSAGPEDYFYNPSSFNAVNNSSFSRVGTDEANSWLDASGTLNWSYSSNSIWISGKRYWAKARSIDNAGNIESNSDIGNGNNFIVTLPADHLQVIVDTTTNITAGTSRDITVNALDNANGVALSYNGTVGFSIANPDATIGPESAGAGLPANYTFVPGSDNGTHVFTNGLTLLKAALGRTLTVSRVSGLAVSAGNQTGINVVPNTTVGLQVLIQGETNAGGKTTAPAGKNTIPLSFTAGAPFTVTVNAVDQYWNVTPSSNPTITATTSDSFDTDPGNKPLSSGTTIFNQTMVSAGVQTMAVSGAGTGNTSSNITINPGTANRLLVMLPGESRVQGKYQTTPLGKSGTPNGILAGNTLVATVYGVDSFYNTDTSDSLDKVWISLSSDTYAVVPSSLTLASGVTTFSLVPVTAGSQVVLATSVLTNPNYVTSNFTVGADTASVGTQRLQLVMQGETAVPGLPPYNQTNGGKSGSPAFYYAGIASTFTVRLVDQYYNLITNNLPMPVVNMHSDTSLSGDPNLTPIFLAMSLNNGVAIGTVTYRTQNNPTSPSTNPTRNLKGWLMTVRDQNDPSDGGSGSYYTMDQSTWVKVYPGPVVKLRVLTANQTYDEGSSPGGAGKTNPALPGSATAGVAFPITIQAVDHYWNRNRGAPGIYTSNVADNVATVGNDVYVQGNSTTPMNQGQVVFASFTPRTAQSGWSFSAVDTDSATISSQTISSVNVKASSNTAVFQVLLPGETNVPGSGGKTGTPTAQTAGVAIQAPGVIVNLVDAYSNPIKNVSGLPFPTVQLAASAASLPMDQYATYPPSLVMTNVGNNGYNATFIASVTLVTAGSNHQIEATDPGLTYAAADSTFFTVSANTLSRYQIVAPGETADAGIPADFGGAGNPAGKTGTPNTQTAGQAFIVTVNATDDWYNIISTNVATYLTSDDAYGTPGLTAQTKALTSGSTTYSVTLLSAQASNGASIPHVLTATGTLNSDVSQNIPMQVASPTKLHILLGGETAVPGNVAGGGKSGSITAATAGTSYSLTVRLTDPYYNVVNNPGGAVNLSLTTTDPYDSPDPDTTKSINSGTYFTTYGHTFKSASTTGWTVTVTTNTGPGYTYASAGPLLVNPDTNAGNPHLLVILLPGESLSQGNVAASGKTGTPFGGVSPVAGSTFTVTVVGTDQYYNLVNDNPVVRVGANASLYTQYPGGASFGLSGGSGTVVTAVNRSTTTASYFVNVVTSNTYNFTASTSTSFTVISGSATLLQLLVQGQTAAPGSPTGKSGSPATPFTAGQMYSATVNATDSYFNLISTAAAKIKMIESDPNATQTNIQQDLTSGTTVFALQFITASGSGWTVRVSTVTGQRLADEVSAALPVVANSPTKIMVTVPGTTLNAGSGISGSPTGATAGAVWKATATITDAYNNAVGGVATGNVWFQTTDPYDTDGTTQPLASGTTSFAIQMYQAGSQTVSMFHTGAYTSGSAAAIPITAGSADRVLVVLPGETYQAGQPPYAPATGGTGGKSGTPTSWIAGTPQIVTVYAVDGYWNQTNSGSSLTLSSPDDPFATGVGAKSLTSGTTTFSVTLFRAVDYNGSSQTIRGNIVGLSNPTYTSPAFTLYPDSGASSPRYLRLLVNGESALPGSTLLKSGPRTGPASDAHFVAGSTITFTLDATDTWGNIISTNVTVNVQTDDTNAKPSPSLSIGLTQGTSTFLWNFVTKRTTDYDLSLAPFTASTATATGFNSAYEHLTIDPDVTKKNLQILVQGETPVQGTGYWPTNNGGKTGAIVTQTAGVAVPITVRVVDDYWNLVEANTTGNPVNIYVITNDSNVVSLGLNPLINGAGTSNGVLSDNTSIILRTATATGWTLTSSGTASGTPFNIHLSSPVKVNAAGLSKLQILLPGETAAPGSVTGKTGTPNTQTAGIAFTLPIGAIRAVDAFYNTVSTVTIATVTLSDIYGTPASQSVSLSGGQSVATLGVTLAVSTDTFSPQVLYANAYNLTTATSAAIPVNQGAPVRLQLLMPGETAVPGFGKSGSVSATVAGATYATTVRMVDAKYNKVTSGTMPTVQVTATDPYAINPAANSLSAGQATFNITFKVANTAPGWTVGAATTAVSGITVSSDTSNFVVVNATTTDRVLVVLPGQTYTPGTARGFLGAITDAVAGTAYISTVTITDRFYNTKTDITPQIQMITSDPYDTDPATTVVNGPTAYTINFRKAPGPWTVFVSTITGYGGAPLISTTTDPITVHAAAPTKLIVLVPGETADPGRAPYDAGQSGGKTGTANTQTAGTPFNVTARLVDSYFNLAESATTFLQLNTDDTNAQSGIQGLGSFQTGSGGQTGQVVITGVTLITRNPAGWQLMVSTATGDPYTMGYSTWIPVQANTAQKLLVLAPGETSQEGNTTGGGKSGSPDSNYPTTPGTLDAFAVGTTYFVEVRAVDAYYNIVTTTAPVVTLTSSDGNAVPVSTDSPKILTGGYQLIPFMMKTAENAAGNASTQTVTASATGFTLSAPYQSGVMTMAPDSVNAVQILVPGQTAAPGSATGKVTTSISTATAGTSFNVTVRTVDRFFNKTNTTPPGMTLASSDPYDNRTAEYQADPLSIALTAGSTIQAWTMTTASTTGWTLTASAPGLNVASDVSPAIPVQSGAAQTLQVILPGESVLAGSGTYNLNGLGRTGTPTAWTSGVSNTLTVNAVDKHFNVVPTASISVKVTPSDLFVSPQTISLIGTTNYAFTLQTATPTASFTALRMSGTPLDASSSSVTSSQITVNANSVVKLQILVPGETAVPGSTTGKTSVSITTQAAGVAFPVTVNVVDLNWNKVPANVKVQLTTTDPYAPALNPQTLSAGATIFQMVFARASSSWTITASTTSDSVTTVSSNTSAVVPVTAGPAAKLQLLIPGETAVAGYIAGGAKGKTGLPTTATAGTNYNVTVRLTDSYYNVQSAATMPSVLLTSTDPFDNESAYLGGNPQSLSAAVAVYGVTPVTAGTWTYTAADQSALGYSSDTSTNVFVQAGAPTKLLIALPNQTLVAGSGINGTAATQIAGVDMPATVYVTDAYSNIVSTGRNPIYVGTNDAYDTDPGSYSLSSGQLQVSSINVQTAGLTTVTAVSNDTNAPALTLASSTFTVTAAGASKLQLVLPGETAVPGNVLMTRGVSGSPNAQTAGVVFYPTVNITDGFWNLVASATGTLRVTSSDPNDQSTGPWTSDGLDPVAINVTTGSYTFPMTLLTSTNTGWTLTAQDLGTSNYTQSLTAAIAVSANSSGGATRKLLTVLPGETPSYGTATGKAGSPSAYTVGNLLQVSVYVTDKFFNTITVPPANPGANTADVQISIVGNQDPYAVNPSTQAINAASGQTTFVYTLYKATTEFFRADDVTVGHGTAWTSSISSQFTASPKSATKLLLLLPGETATPGSGAPGKTGTVNTFVAGSTYTATLQVSDTYFNAVTSHLTEQVAVRTSDPYDTEPATQTISNGQSVANVTLQFRTASTGTASAVDTNLVDPTTTWATSVSPDTGSFNVLAGSATKLMVVMPGEAPLQGSATGRTGSPTSQVAGTAFVTTVYLTDAQYNLVSLGTMPEVLLTSNDSDVNWQSPANPSQLLNGVGYMPWTVVASSAQLSFVITASTTPTTPVGTTAITSGASNALRVYPGPKHHLHITGLPTTSSAGVGFSGCVVMHDAYHNILSTGPHTSTSTVTSISFNAETTGNGYLTDGNQDPPWLPGTTTFNLITGSGQKCLTNYFSLRAAGSRWLQAVDDSDPINVNSTRGWTIDTNNVWSPTGVVYSTPSYITVTPGAPSQWVVDPAGDQNVPAGTLSSLGRWPVTARLADPYDNYADSAGITVALTTANVSGVAGTISFDASASSAVPPVPTTSTVTNSSGAVSVYYYVSSHAGDYGAVRFSATVGAQPVANQSGRMITTGGDTSKLAFVSPPVSQTAGQDYLHLPLFTLERRDDFDNPTDYQGSTVQLDYTANGQVAVHAGRGFSSSNHDYEFQDPNLLGVPITNLAFSGGDTQKTFVYFDKMSSTPIEDGRVGTWTLRAYIGGTGYANSNVRTSYDLIVNPDAKAQIAFHNPVRTLVAGTPLSLTGNPNLSYLNLEIQDTYGNPTPVVSTATLFLASYRVVSSSYDAYGFSSSTSYFAAPPAPSFVNPITTVTINSGFWGTTFYYLDTNASENYTAPVSSPMLRAFSTGTIDGALLSTGTQKVTISPNALYQIGFLSAPSALVAGTTSQQFRFASEDIFGNPSPITNSAAVFTLTTDVPGTASFATPYSTSAFQSGTSSATIAVGQSTMTFYMKDTLAGDRTVTISRNGFVSANSTYTVAPAPASQLVFATPSRYLVAGTTVQYEPNYSVGAPTNTVITVRAMDPYLNISSVTANTVVNFYVSNSTGAYGYTDASNLSLFKYIPGPVLPNVLPVQMLAGNSSVSMYYYDTQQGTRTMVAFDSVGALTSATTTHFISPAPAAYLTIEPINNVNNPMPVNNLLPFGNIVARDQFGNVARGDVKNGQYYTGTVQFGTSGSTTTVQIYDATDLAHVVSSYTFKVADAGTYSNLLMTDSVQETLHVSATDFVTVVPPVVPSNNAFDPNEDTLQGWTNDAARIVPVHSYGDLVTAGVVMTPVDLSPVPTTDPTYNAKQVLLLGTRWQGKTSLAQGDGTVPVDPQYLPVPMMRLSFQVQPPTYSSSTIISQIVLTKNLASGALADSDIAELDLNYDINNDGKFQPESTYQGVQPDPMVSSTTFVNGVATFANLSLPITAASAKNYFVSVRVASDVVTALPANLGLKVTAASQVTVVGLGMASNNFPVVTSTSPVLRQPATIRVDGQDLAAWWDPGTGLGQQNYVSQGSDQVGMLRLGFWTDAFQGAVNRIRVSRTGTGDDTDIADVKIYKDCNSDGVFTPSLDNCDITSGATFVNQVTSITLNSNLIVTPTTSYVFIAYHLSPSASLNTQGASVRNPSDIFPADGTVGAFSQINSTQVPVQPSTDELDLTRVNDPANGFNIGQVATQGDTDVVAMKMTLAVRNPLGGGLVNSAIWNHLRLDRGNPNGFNHARDIDAIRVYYDNNNDGLFEVNADTLVTSTSKVYEFPHEVLTADVDASTTVIPVNDASAYPPAPGLVWIDDEQMTYTALDLTNNKLTGVVRASSGTVAAAHTAGTDVEGQAYLDLVDPNGILNGQEILVTPKNYFIVMDINYLANVNSQDSLGVEIASTSYFVVDTPDLVGNHSGNIGLPPLGQTAGTYITNVKEYVDTVVLTSTNTTVGDYLQQGATNQAVLRFDMRTNHARAGFTGITVSRAGTAADSDITSVKVWYDRAGTGIFNVAVDSPPLGSGVFGNPAAGLARINFDTVTYSTDLNDLTTGPLKVDTAVRKLNNYFITFDMANIATPQNTIGVTVSSPVFVNISAPNTMSGTNMPASSKLRTIIPKPQRLQASSTYYFSTDTGNYPLPHLLAPVMSNDVTATLNTSSGMPTSGLMVIDAEVLGYTGILGNVLTGLSRCVSGSCTTPPAIHSTYTYVNSVEQPNYIGVNYTQGMRNVALIKFSLQDIDDYNIRWFSLDLGRTPGGLSGADSDLSAVKVYSGDTLYRTSDGEIGIQNTLVGSGVSQFGSIHLAVNDPNLGSPGYVLISTAPATYWVVADISQSATAGHAFALNAITKDAFTVGALVAGDGIHSVMPTNFPMQTGDHVIGATVDTMTVVFTDLLPTVIQQNATNVPVAKMNLKVNQNTVIWTGLTLTRTGAKPDDGDVLRMNVWKDINDNGIFDDGNTLPLSTLSQAITASDSSLQVAVSTSFPIGPAVLLVGSELIRYANNDLAGNFTGLTRGFLGTTAAVHAIATNVRGVVNDTLVSDAGTKPGQITPGTDNFTNSVRAITFTAQQIIPNVTDKITGMNYFITYDINPFVPVYRDLNNNGVQDAGEAVSIGGLISATTSFAVITPDLVTLSANPPLTTKLAAFSEYPDQVSFSPDTSITPVYATQGDKDIPILKFSLRSNVSTALFNTLKISRKGAGAVQTQGSNDDIGLVKVYRDVNFNGILEPTTDELISSGTFVQPDPNGTNPKTVQLTIKDQLLSPTTQTYFVAYDIATGATSNNTEGLTIIDPGWFGGSFTPIGVDQMLPNGIPVESRQVTISPLTVRVSGQSLAPGSALEGEASVPLMSVTIQPSINQVVVSSLTLTQLGTITTSTGTPPNLVGDGDFSRLYVHLDTNYNGKLDAGDSLLGSLPWGTTSSGFIGGLATIPFSTAVSINTSGATLLVSADIGTVDGSGAATQGHSAGISVASAGAITMTPLTALQDQSNVYPIRSALVPIFNFQTVQVGTVTMRPDLTTSTVSGLEGVYMPEAWVHDQGAISAHWTTVPPSLPANVTVTYQVGMSASSNTTIAPSLTGWVSLSQTPPITLTGLGLEDTKTYYFFVRTITTINGLTLPPSPVMMGTVHVDVTKPAPPSKFINLPKTSNTGIVTLQWPVPSDYGPSGIFAYKIRQFEGTSPVPTEIIMTSTPSYTFGSNINNNAPAYSLHAPGGAASIGGASTTSPLVYLNGETGAARSPNNFYRWQIQTINGAGTASEWSTISETVNTGLPEDIISEVSNYPNPVDTRKGGLEGKTFITYLLAGDADVEITIYDLLGYRVMHWSFPGGTEGGRQGPNTVPPGGWDGTNEAGQKVSKGGYLAQIKAGGQKGSATVIRKIGVIH